MICSKMYGSIFLDGMTCIPMLSPKSNTKSKIQLQGAVEVGTEEKVNPIFDPRNVRNDIILSHWLRVASESESSSHHHARLP
jgi:hypothetical protein